jgi:hypothetical protein
MRAILDRLGFVGDLHQLPRSLGGIGVLSPGRISGSLSKFTARPATMSKAGESAHIFVGRSAPDGCA